MKTLTLKGCGTVVGTYPAETIETEQSIFEGHHGQIFNVRDAHPHEIAKELEHKLQQSRHKAASDTIVN